MEWLPTLSAPVLNEAIPPTNVTVLRLVAPSLKVTVPVGVPVVLDFTVAFKVTDCPNEDGFTEDVTRAEVAALFTVCASAAEVLPKSVALPTYTAVMECVPAARVDVFMAAVPPLSVAEPSVDAPSLNVTVPSAVLPKDWITVAVRVTGFP